MPTQAQLSQEGAAIQGTDSLAGSGAGSAEAVQVPSPQIAGPEEGLFQDPRIRRLPVEIDVAVPIPKFRVRNLLALKAGQLVDSEWGQAEDLPLATSGAQLAWAEFEVMDARLAVRVTRLV